MYNDVDDDGDGGRGAKKSSSFTRSSGSSSSSPSSLLTSSSSELKYPFLTRIEILACFSCNSNTHFPITTSTSTVQEEIAERAVVFLVGKILIRLKYSLWSFFVISVYFRCEMPNTLLLYVRSSNRYSPPCKSYAAICRYSCRR